MSTERESGSEHLFKNNVLCIVTGASKGFGNAVVRCFTDQFILFHSLDGQVQRTAKLSFILLSRDERLLNELKRDVESRNEAINVISVIAGDLRENETLRRFSRCLDEIDKLFDEAVIVHNAGSLGDPSKLVNEYCCNCSELLSAYFEFNVLSTMKMTATFLNVFETKAKHRTIVNISSLAAIVAMKGLSLYATAKAARDAYFRNVAIETCNTSVLNYSPGPLQTEMTDILKQEGFHTEFFLKPGNLLRPEESVEKLLRLLNTGKYENGAHVDVFDVT